MDQMQAGCASRCYNDAKTTIELGTPLWVGGVLRMHDDPFTFAGMEVRMKTKKLITGCPSRDLTKLGWAGLAAGKKPAARACFLAVLCMRRAPRSHKASARRGLFAVELDGQW